MKIILIAISISFITSCKKPSYIEIARDNMICIDGVEYFNLYRQMAPHFKPDGTLYTCEVEK